MHNQPMLLSSKSVKCMGGFLFIAPDNTFSYSTVTFFIESFQALFYETLESTLEPYGLSPKGSVFWDGHTNKVNHFNGIMPISLNTSTWWSSSVFGLVHSKSDQAYSPDQSVFFFNISNIYVYQQPNTEPKLAILVMEALQSAVNIFIQELIQNYEQLGTVDKACFLPSPSPSPSPSPLPDSCTYIINGDLYSSCSEAFFEANLTAADLKQYTQQESEKYSFIEPTQGVIDWNATTLEIHSTSSPCTTYVDFSFHAIQYFKGGDFLSSSDFIYKVVNPIINDVLVNYLEDYFTDGVSQTISGESHTCFFPSPLPSPSPSTSPPPSPSNTPSPSAILLCGCDLFMREHET